MLTVNDFTKKNKWESVEVLKQVKREEYWDKKNVVANQSSDSNWDEDDFHGTAQDSELSIEKETTKISLENVESPADWDDEDFQGTDVNDDQKKETVEEQKFRVETFKTIPETESWDDEDFQVSFYDLKLGAQILNELS